MSFGPKMAKALDVYLRARRGHPNSGLPWMWISDKGRFTASGIRQMLVRRGRAVGVDISPHNLRHAFAHGFLVGDIDAGIMPSSPEDLARLLGHTSTKLIFHTYGAWLTQDRANAANRRLSPAERV